MDRVRVGGRIRVVGRVVRVRVSWPLYQRSLMRIHYPKFRYMTPTLSLSVSIAFKGANFYILFAITAACVVPCGDPKTSPRTSSIVHIIYHFWSFEINGNTQRIKKLVFISRTIY